MLSRNTITRWRYWPVKLRARVKLIDLELVVLSLVVVIELTAFNWALLFIVRRRIWRVAARIIGRAWSLLGQFATFLLSRLFSNDWWWRILLDIQEVQVWVRCITCFRLGCFLQPISDMSFRFEFSCPLNVLRRLIFIWIKVCKHLRLLICFSLNLTWLFWPWFFATTALKLLACLYRNTERGFETLATFDLHHFSVISWPSWF